MELLGRMETTTREVQSEVGVQSFQERLAEEIVKLSAEDNSAFNVSIGLHRNNLGAELVVQGFVGKRLGISIGNLNTLGGDVYYAEALDDLFGPTPYLVTAAGLARSGYVFVPEDPVEAPEIKPAEYVGGYHFPNGMSPGHSLVECDRRLCRPKL